MSSVWTIEGIREAYYNAWFESRVDLFTVCLSAQQSGERGHISTAFKHSVPIIDPKHPVEFRDGTAWIRNFFELGTDLQAWLVGVGNRPIWVNLIAEHGKFEFTPPQGPFLVRSFPEIFEDQLRGTSLSQLKERKYGVWRSRDGSKNRMRIRVPHK